MKPVGAVTTRSEPVTVPTSHHSVPIHPTARQDAGGTQPPSRVARVELPREVQQDKLDVPDRVGVVDHRDPARGCCDAVDVYSGDYAMSAPKPSAARVHDHRPGRALPPSPVRWSEEPPSLGHRATPVALRDRSYPARRHGDPQRSRRTQRLPSARCARLTTAGSGDRSSEPRRGRPDRSPHPQALGVRARAGWFLSVTPIPAIRSPHAEFDSTGNTGDDDGCPPLFAHRHMA